MKRKLLRLMPVAAVLLTASCIDDKYDLREVDTTSRFPAKDLVIPLNMDAIKLDAIISVGDDDDVQIDDEGNFYFHKKGENMEGKDYCFESDPVRVEKITIQKPADISQKVDVEIQLHEGVLEKWEQFAADKTIEEILADETLKATVGIAADDEILSVKVNDQDDFNMSASDIDARITKLDKLGIAPLALNIDVKLDGLQNVADKVTVENLKFKLPSGLTVTNITDGGTYDMNDGTMSFPLIEINGKKTITATITELTYAAMKTDGAIFDPVKHTFTYGMVSTASGTATLKIGDLNHNSKIGDITKAVTAAYSCDVYFSDNLVVNIFSGGIDYKIDEDIDIDPVVIDGVPEFLEQTGTNLELDNPQLYLTINNPFFDNGIQPTSTLIITGNSVFEHALNINAKEKKLVLSPNENDLLHKDYDYEKFDGLRQVLSGEDGIPDQLLIDVETPLLKSNEVKDLELGKDLGPITGSWEFYAKLALTEDAIIQYVTEWDDWGSDDLEGLTLEKATVTFDVKKDVALNAESIKFTLLGEPKDVTVETALSGEEKQTITLDIKEKITNIRGGKVEVKLKGQGETIKGDQQIEISNLRMTVTGHYDKDF